MSRLNVLLLLALLVSALFLVHTSYESRQLFVSLERERARARELAIENESLQVDRRDQGTHGRVERVARERLRMRNATAAVTQYVEPGAVAASTGGAP